MNEQEAVLFERTNCPICGSKKTLGKEIAIRATLPGMPVPEKAALFMEVVPIPERAGLVVGKVMKVVSDYCLDCGVRYAVSISEVRGQIEIKPRQQPPGPEGLIRGN